MSVVPRCTEALINELAGKLIDTRGVDEGGTSSAVSNHDSHNCTAIISRIVDLNSLEEKSKEILGKDGWSVNIQKKTRCDDIQEFILSNSFQSIV
jgi:hypothetical protein